MFPDPTGTSTRAGRYPNTGRHRRVLSTTTFVHSNSQSPNITRCCAATPESLESIYACS